MGTEHIGLCAADYRRGYAVLTAAFADINDIVSSRDTAGLSPVDLVDNEHDPLGYRRLSDVVKGDLGDADTNHPAVTLLAAVAFDAAAMIREVSLRGNLDLDGVAALLDLLSRT
ncbi:MAG: hypothetical protein QOI55_1731 [Actinomycetota bacterium]|nr:hypothetical protein [Actinomycetota bacterium]